MAERIKLLEQFRLSAERESFALATEISSLRDSVRPIPPNIAADVADLHWQLEAERRRNDALAQTVRGLAVQVANIGRPVQPDGAVPPSVAGLYEDIMRLRDRLNTELGPLSQRITSLSTDVTTLTTRLDEELGTGGRLPQPVAALVSTVQGLSRAVATITDRTLPAVSRQVDQVFRAFENEQVYRRGCEYLFGTNGYVGLTYEVSAKLGFSLIKKAADGGNVDAQYLCGRAYFLDHGCGISYPDAVKYFRLAADQGHSYGQVRLGICHYGGHGVERNMTRAQELFANSARAGNAFGQCWKGIADPAGLDAKVAYYRLSAEQGNCAGQRCLADCLENGRGVNQNLAEAAKYYRLAAEQGHGSAQADYARMLENGSGVTRDYLHAGHYYLRAVNDRWTGERGAQSACQGYVRCLRAVKGGG
jgi:hypothetical protein